MAVIHTWPLSTRLRAGPPAQYMFLFCSQRQAQARIGECEVASASRRLRLRHGESGALLFSGNTFWQENPLVIGLGGGGLEANLRTPRRYCAWPNRRHAMKRILIASALALATAAPAFAADLPPAAAPPPRAPVAYMPAPPAFSWTGFYVGLNAGYAFGQSSWNSPIGSTGTFDVNGALAGVTLGGNYQIGQFVVGAEGDIDWQNVRGAMVGGNCTLARRRGCQLRQRQQLGRHVPRPRSASPLTACCSTQQAAAPCQHQGFAQRAALGQQHGIGLELRRRRRSRHDRQLDGEGRIYGRRFPAAVLRARQLPCRSRRSTSRFTRTWPAAASIINSSRRGRRFPARRGQRARHRNPADSAGLLFFCTIQGLAERTVLAPKAHLSLASKGTV